MQPEDDSSRPASLVTPPRRIKPAAAANNSQEQTAASTSPTRVAEAELLAAQAKVQRAQIENSPESPYRATMLVEAEALEAEAAQLRDSPALRLVELQRGQGGEISPLPDSKMPYDLNAIARTVQAPSATLAAEATVDRLNLAREANVLTLAVEAAASMGAQNAFQQMLCHQMAAGHALAMQMIAMTERQAQFHQGRRALEKGGAALVDAARNATAVARLMDSCARAALTFDRLQNGGRQSVTVQHVVVGEGGQAVVAANLDTANGQCGHGAEEGEWLTRARDPDKV